MSELEDVKSILIEMRDNQKLSLEKQDEHIGLAQQQIERARKQVSVCSASSSPNRSRLSNFPSR